MATARKGDIIKTLLVSTSFEIVYSLENIGVGRLVSYLKENNKEVRAININLRQEIGLIFDEIDLSYDLFGFSMYSDTMEIILKIIDMIKSKKKDAVIIVGSKFITGYYNDFVNDRYFDNIDYFVLGDGEYTLLDIVNHMEKNADLDRLAEKHEHIACKSSFINKKPLNIDINKLPLPDREWLRTTNHMSTAICDCHGCVGKCTFCSQTNFYRKWNGRSPENLFEEVKMLCSETNVSHIYFTGGALRTRANRVKRKLKSFVCLSKTKDLI